MAAMNDNGPNPLTTRSHPPLKQTVSCVMA